MKSSRVLVLVSKRNVAYSETFILNHIDMLHAAVVSLNVFMPLAVPDKGSIALQTLRRIRVALNRYRLERVLRHHKGSILVEYGTTAAKALPVLKKLNNNIIVHFHGFDAHRSPVVQKYAEAYKEIFQLVNAIVVVSKHMHDTIIQLGAQEEKVHHIVYGIDQSIFRRTDVGKNPAIFFACGRFVEKKAPDLTIRAFHKAWHLKPEIRLRMAGDGPLWAACEELVKELGLTGAVELLGKVEPDVIAEELRGSRAFVQHSVTASDGDSEGTPVAILEAMCSAVPVIATRHAGITDMVQEGKSGLLVDEHDVEAMAVAMLRLANNANEAAGMGEYAYAVVLQNFTLEASIGKLKALL